MIFITALVLIFILRLRFPKGKSVVAIRERFDATNDKTVLHSLLVSFINILTSTNEILQLEKNKSSK